MSEQTDDFKMQVQRALTKVEEVKNTLENLFREMSVEVSPAPVAAPPESPPPVTQLSAEGFVLKAAEKGAPVVSIKAAANFAFDPSEKVREIKKHEFMQALVLPEFEQSNRRKLWLEGVEEIFEPGALEEVREEINILSGKTTKLGFHIGAVAVEGYKGETEYLYILENSLQNKMLIIGPDTSAPGFNERYLESRGITYVEKARCSWTVDRFVEGAISAMYEDAVDAELVENDASVDFEDVVLTVRDLLGESIQGLFEKEGESVVIPVGTRIGDLFQKAQGKPALYKHMPAPKV